MLLLDFYVDEPACFGVPPYLSPYCRYVAGALVSGGIPQKEIQYQTVDNWRANGLEPLEDSELLVVIAGATVPGKYLGGKIGTISELFTLLEKRKKSNAKNVTLIGGPIRYASIEIRERIRELGGFLVRGDVELYAYYLAKQKDRMLEWLLDYESNKSAGLPERRTYENQVDIWAQAGAFLYALHPNSPNLILEIETYRGCTRDIFCSFCTEAYYGKPVFRSIKAITDEVRELHAKGARYFRLGRQADLMTYLPYMQEFKAGFPRPNPQNLLKLYEGFHKAAPNLKLLHLDNINPGLIATFPEESTEIIKIICDHNTAGDTAAMGIESVDPKVVTQNDLKCDTNQAMLAIEIVNKHGSRRENGIPKLLPGLNFIHGLPGEDANTFEKNYNFLKEILDQDLLLRRINIRQVIAFENTKLTRIQKKESALRSGANAKKVKSSKLQKKQKQLSLLTKRFRYFRDKIRTEIDRPMLARNFPLGTVLENVILETRNQGFYLGRPLGSYPVTIKIPDDDAKASGVWQELQNNTIHPISIVITGYEERSLTGLVYPIAINRLGMKALKSIPSVGKKRANLIFQNRPLGDMPELEAILEGPSFIESDAWEWS